MTADTPARTAGGTSVRGATWADGLRLGAGTFLAIPVPPPAVVDRTAGALALVSAPLWGVVVGVAAGVGGAALWWVAGASGNDATSTALVVGAAVYALTALLTRGLHVDGLADTADGLGSGRTGSAGLEVMRQSTVGAFAVVAVVASAFLQVSSVGSLFADGSGALAVAAAAVLARTPLAWLARTGTPADDTGLGRTVVGSVGSRGAVLTGVVWSAAAGALLLGGGFAVPVALGAIVMAWSPALWLRRRALARFGVLTGDVLGAAVEASTTAVLVLLALTG